MAPSTQNARKSLRKKKKKKIDEVKLIKQTNLVNLCSDDSVLKQKDEISSMNGCTTPKAQKYQIPEIGTCPPAPKKRRIVSCCMLRSRPISFFDPPDIELFFESHLTSIYNHVHTHETDGKLSPLPATVVVSVFSPRIIQPPSASPTSHLSGPRYRYRQMKNSDSTPDSSRQNTPLQDEEPKMSLEDAWFHANYEFRIPML
ncbi:hypothetical protein R6Q59_011755 [Mikania micrantha]